MKLEPTRSPDATFSGGWRLVGMPRDHLRPEDLAEAADKAACERLEVELQRARWAQRASRSWAALTAAKDSQSNL